MQSCVAAKEDQPVSVWTLVEALLDNVKSINPCLLPREAACVAWTLEEKKQVYEPCKTASAKRPSHNWPSTSSLDNIEDLRCAMRDMMQADSARREKRICKLLLPMGRVIVLHEAETCSRAKFKVLSQDVELTYAKWQSNTARMSWRFQARMAAAKGQWELLEAVSNRACVGGWAASFECVSCLRLKHELLAVAEKMLGIS